MADKIPSGRASIMVQSLDGARPIMVERSMYWNNRGAGTDTIGGYLGLNDRTRMNHEGQSRWLPLFMFVA